MAPRFAVWWGSLKSLRSVPKACTGFQCVAFLDAFASLCSHKKGPQRGNPCYTLPVGVLLNNNSFLPRGGPLRRARALALRMPMAGTPGEAHQQCRPRSHHLEFRSGTSPFPRRASGGSSSRRRQGSHNWSPPEVLLGVHERFLFPSSGGVRLERITANLRNNHQFDTARADRILWGSKSHFFNRRRSPGHVSRDQGSASLDPA
jgi:hypothetical protein